MVSHAQSNESVHDRLLQRRLALLAGLQATAPRQDVAQWILASARLAHRPGLACAFPDSVLTIAQAQAETVRLERKQRQENSGKARSNLMYSTGFLGEKAGPAATRAPAAAAPPSATWRLAPSWHVGGV